ncbi:MAG TPA: serine/threonine protein kinase [Candidatus Agrococcus pullicola]|uniref:non-specific serine/threonine protein kinase n=1 Tax=Candidatus Agrococcus pullicola TaxID=2838429 RepID=A0A9D2CAU4_9MICO|nr:serine/threonine protein kinase [Candidatus Agrococcus pullicola]
MSPKRAPAPAPDIPGYDFLQVLGSGGFADVYLYQQALPSRRVAVKVLLPSQLNQNTVEHFRNEANLMAQLSEHPSIVTIYGAAVTPDGRPYLAMEYAPKPNLGLRYQKERFSVPEVLTLGVQIAGAVETAHRAGILHRDIKPANILVTAYNRPALTDFGIATAGGAVHEESGMSVPWSPPEAFASTPWAGPESDVFSLAATLYTLLAGRTPFELPGDSNASIDLIARIEAGEVAPLARGDVPSELENTLLAAMAANPSRRYSTALDFGRALQRVEANMALPITQIDVLDDSLAPDASEVEDGGATRVRGVVTIDAQAEHRTDSAVRHHRAPIQVDDRTVVRAEVGMSEQSEAPAELREAEPPRPDRRRWLPITIAAAVLIAVVGTVGGLVLFGNNTLESGSNPDETEDVPAPPAAPPSMPIAFVAEIDGDEVHFSWQNPQPRDGDRYQYRYEPSNGNPETGWLETPELTVPLDPEEPTCLSVSIVRASGQSSQSAQGCTDE